MNVRLNDNQKVTKINSAVKVHELMHSVLMRENKMSRVQEHFWILGLNNTNNILFVELVCLGADNKVMVSPKEVFRIGFIKFAQSFILVHNHPSGANYPSDKDNEFTDYYTRLGAFLNIPVLDHIIITESNGYYSYAETGNLINYINQKSLIDYDFELNHEKLIYNQIKEKITKEINTNIAKEFIKTKTPIKLINEITGVQKYILKQMKQEQLLK